MKSNSDTVWSSGVLNAFSFIYIYSCDQHGCVHSVSSVYQLSESWLRGNNTKHPCYSVDITTMGMTEKN